MLFGGTSREGGGAGFARGPPLPLIDQSGCSRKISEILEDSEFVWHGCGHGAAGGVFCDATNQELSRKLLRQTSLPARHQYGDCK
jgi:hypothetical protein